LFHIFGKKHWVRGEGAEKCDRISHCGREEVSQSVTLKGVQNGTKKCHELFEWLLTSIDKDLPVDKDSIRLVEDLSTNIVTYGCQKRIISEIFLSHICRDAT
jgi:hypothetical protein